MQENQGLKILTTLDSIDFKSENYALNRFANLDMEVRYIPNNSLNMQINSGIPGQSGLKSEFLIRLLDHNIKSPIKPVMDDKNRLRLLGELPVNNEQDLVPCYKYLKSALIQEAGRLYNVNYDIPKQLKYSVKSFGKIDPEAALLESGMQDFAIKKINENRYLVYIESPHFYEKVNIFPDKKSGSFIYRSFLKNFTKDEFNSESGSAVCLYLMHTLQQYCYVRPVIEAEGDKLKLELQIILPFFLNDTFSPEMAIRKLFSVMFVVKHPVMILSKTEAAKEYLLYVWDV